MPDNSRKILLATEKAFTAAAVKSIEEVFETASKNNATNSYDLIKLENYKGGSDELKSVIKEKKVNAMIVRSDKLTGDVMDSGKGSEGEDLKLIVRAGAGVDTIDLSAASERNLVVMNTPGQNSNAVAELSFGMMITNARNHYDGSSGYELKGKTLGLHGFGQVARNMYRLAQGFGMQSYAFDPFLSKEQIESSGPEGSVKSVESYADLFKTCDYVSLHIPCTDETRGSIKKEHLLSMPKNGVLVNTARSEVVDEGGLVEAFKERTDLSYLADVQPLTDVGIKGFEELGKKRVFFTPKKMGAQTSEANNNAGIAAAKQIVDYFEKGDVKFQVNKPGQKF